MCSGLTKLYYFLFILSAAVCCPETSKMCRNVIFACILSAAFLQISDAITVMSIDFGSEWIKIAIVKPGVPMEIVLNKESKRKTEVAVSLRNGEREFGNAAFAKGVRFPPSTYFYIQDLLAKDLSHPLVKQYMQRFPYYKLEEDKETGYVVFRHDDETTYSPEEILGMVFNHSQSLAEAYAEQKVDTCVITVPTFFNQAERKAVLYAAQLGGLKVSQLMDANAASALNYGVFRRKHMNTTAQYIMLYDMGATSTVATIVGYQVVKTSDGTDPQLSIHGVGFDRTLGGLSIEFKLRDLLIEKFNGIKKSKMEFRDSPRAMAKLLKEARRVKQVLSANADHFAQIEGLIDDEDFRTQISRQELEELCKDLWPRVATPMREAIKSAGLSWDVISKIILVGAGTRVPKVQEILLKESGKSDLGKMLNTDEAPALGASYQAAAHSSGFRVKTFNVRSATVYPIEVNFNRDVELEDGTTGVKHVRKTLFQRNNPYPQKKVITFSRFYEDFSFSTNYGDVSFLTEDQASMFGTKKNISSVTLGGVKEAYLEHGSKNGSEYKGVKVHFRMDESGILNLEESESLFEVNKTEEVKIADNETEDDSSTFQKLKEGFSSLFGGSDEEKEPQTKKETATEDNKETKEEKSEEQKSEKTQESQDEKSENKETKPDESDEPTQDKKKSNEKEDIEKPTNETKGNTTATEKDKPKTKTAIKKIKQSVVLKADQTSIEFKVVSQETAEKSKARLLELSARDQFKIDREKAMNTLEAYIYDKQDKLYQEDYEKALSPEELETVRTTLSEASDWMFDLEGEPEAKVYSDKLAEIRKVTRPWLLRMKERNELPEILNDMEGILNYTVHLLTAINVLNEDEQIYTEVEINLLSRMLNETMDWKNDTMKKQQALEPHQDNVMKPDDVKMKIGELNREVQYILNKAKTAKPKKPKTEAKKKSGNETVVIKKNATKSVNETENKGTNGDYDDDDELNEDEGISEGDDKETKEEDNKETKEDEEGEGEQIDAPPQDKEETTTETTTTESDKPPPHVEDEL